MISIECPLCGSPLLFAEALIGRSVVCGTCRIRFEICSYNSDKDIEAIPQEAPPVITEGVSYLSVRKPQIVDRDESNCEPPVPNWKIHLRGVIAVPIFIYLFLLVQSFIETYRPHGWFLFFAGAIATLPLLFALSEAVTGISFELLLPYWEQLWQRLSNFKRRIYTFGLIGFGATLVVCLVLKEFIICAGMVATATFIAKVWYLVAQRLSKRAPPYKRNIQ